MNFYQVFLPISSLLYLLIVFVVRSMVHFKQTGNTPLVFGSSDKAHDYIARVYKIMVLGSIISISIYSFFPDFYYLILPIWYLDLQTLKNIGIALLIISFLWTSIAQYQMSKSWRIGIDYSEKTDLVDTGLFRYSRNPVFLGVIISYVGTFLIIPNLLSFSMMIVTYVTIQLQVRMEEEYLLETHGSVYESYKETVNRWL